MPVQVRGLAGLVAACRGEWAGYSAAGGRLPQVLLLATAPSIGITASGAAAASSAPASASSSAGDNAFILMQYVERYKRYKRS